MARRYTDREFEKVIRQVGLRAKKAQAEIRLGVPNTTHGPSGLPLPELAAIHEFGDRRGHIPERAPFRKSIRANAGKYKRLLASASRIAVVEQKLKAYNLIGAAGVADVQRLIAQGLEPENADSTKARKGSSTPLIDTGAFRQSVTFEVRPRRV